MTLASMTGFARADGSAGSVRWAWEVKTVNARGLDVRVRVPPGYDAVEVQARALIGKALVRGTCNANLTVIRDDAATAIRVNEVALEALVAALEPIRARVNAAPVSLESLLAVRGVVEVAEPAHDPDSRSDEIGVLLAGLEGALSSLVAARREEGRSLRFVLDDRLNEIARLADLVERSPARQPDAIRQKLGEQIQLLIGAAPSFDADRLHQEAILLASKADIREELDRLQAHIASGRALLAEGGAVGRRLDFLAQELGRETNTLCAKSNDVSLTTLGLELKVIVEQFREQVQNLE